MNDLPGYGKAFLMKIGGSANKRDLKIIEQQCNLNRAVPKVSRRVSLFSFVIFHYILFLLALI
jgi:hypothetical protein